MRLSDLSSPHAYDVNSGDDLLEVVLNAGHPLIRDVYAPLAAADTPDSRRAATQVVLLAVAKAVTERGSDIDLGLSRRWDDFLATLLERCR